MERREEQNRGRELQKPPLTGQSSVVSKTKAGELGERRDGCPETSGCRQPREHLQVSTSPRGYSGMLHPVKNAA